MNKIFNIISGILIGSNAGIAITGLIWIHSGELKLDLITGFLIGINVLTIVGLLYARKVFNQPVK